MKGAQIGEKCILGQNVFVAPTAKIGNGVKIQNNVCVYDAVIIEDHVFCGPSMVFTNVINPRAQFERKNEYRTTRLCQGGTIGANATIICGTTIGKYAFVGAGSVVTRDIPDYALVYGNPARQHGWMCECGIKLTNQISPSDKDKITCNSCNRIFYLQDGKLTEKS
jgi:UDP-2-acetamido-3-amino-2,3-dideoxy-glucuronate N-acetyltransferase